MRRRDLNFLPLALAALELTSPVSAWAQGKRSPNRSRAEAAPIYYAGRADAMDLADQIAIRNRLDRMWVRDMIGQARFLTNVPRLMLPRGGGGGGRRRNWQAYRQRFVEPIRINAGAEFWRTHAATLSRAERDFGVPPEIVVGIIGVETIYGRIMGNFRVIDALATLSFDFPLEHPRADQRIAYFRGELESFLTAASRQGDSPLDPLGSYAGAMGMPQFMPSSIDKYAVDYDGNGHIDLAGSPVDAIGSVANYFKGYGWQAGQPSFFPASVDETNPLMPTLLAPDIVPSFSADSISAAGVELPPVAKRYGGLLALIELQNGSAPTTFVAGTQNFYVITRYNWSSFYAMSVLDLGQEVKAALSL
ncbi:lytic murein transglycosylase B [Variovorax dokdonensis]|uniref:Lytic murein transglycosylase B n=1 Tax=Variovorax dokdonensis TaxID=344883 RepID=A0ABT7NDU7_9BURK|nr:lytic murein transglycosylase B [Variovorax dokdonensis]MDM0046121.1 lytic murein transglycosylase B [Variovorax dokdonensis]